MAPLDGRGSWKLAASKRKFHGRRRFYFESRTLSSKDSIMKNSDLTCDRSPQPPLGELFAKYLERQAAAQAAGFAVGDAPGEVVPFEAVPVQAVDARTAWTEALAALRFYDSATDLRSLSAPTDWPVLVANQEPAMSLPMCVGNFPQSVRNLNPLLHSEEWTRLQSRGGTPIAAPALATWADQSALSDRFPQILIVIGVMRLGRHFDRANELLRRTQKAVPANWKDAWTNEKAALAWHRGQVKEAMALWQAQPVSVPVLFNRGMSALFTGQSRESRSWLSQAVEQIPETSSWHHLGRLYLALAEMR
jgi:hypothetical protein